MDFSFTTLIRGRLQKIIFYFRKLFKRFLVVRLLFVGTPVTEQLYMGISKEENLELLLDGALRKLTEFCKDNGISTTLFYNLTKKHNRLADYLRKNGFACMENFPNARLQISTHSLEEYINQLGPSTRKDIRRKMRKSASLVELKTEVATNLENIIDDIYKLYLNNFNESDLHFEILTPDFFKKIFYNMPGVIKCFLTKDGEKIVAFNLCLIKNKVCIDKFIGLDYSVAHRYKLYYTTFCHNIEWCIKNGVYFYEFGQGDYDAKIRLGAQLIPLFIYIKNSNPLLSLAMKSIIKLIEPKNFDPVLKNIKKYKKDVFSA
jgi:predicted N-acyltransferase